MFRKSHGLWGFLDSWGHRLHAPELIQRKLCDKFDSYLIGDRDDDPTGYYPLEPPNLDKEQ